MAEPNGTGTGWPDGEVHEIQATAEQVKLTGRVEFAGASYRLATKVGLMPMLKFAHAASAGLGADDLEGMAAMYALIRDCIDPADWAAFERAAIGSRAGGDELLEVIGQAMAQITARPTPAPSGSASPAPPESANSKAPSGRVPPEFVNRPDLIDVASASPARLPG